MSSEVRVDIVDQPQLSIVDGSGQGAIRLFDTMAIDFPEAVQTAALQEDLARGVSIFTQPESFIPLDSPGVTEYRQEQAAAVLYDLLELSGEGRLLDYDGGTWVALLADATYRKASEVMHRSRETSATLRQDRRTVALRGLAMYAQRRHVFAVEGGGSRSASVTDIRQGIPSSRAPQLRPGAA